MSDNHEDVDEEFRSSVQEGLPRSTAVVEERQDTNGSDQSRRAPEGVLKATDAIGPLVHGGNNTKTVQEESERAHDQNDFLATFPPVQFDEDIAPSPVIENVDNIDEVNSKAQSPQAVVPPLVKQSQEDDQSIVVPKPSPITSELQQQAGELFL